MKVLFGGVRGSTPRAEPAFAAYGGHTTSLLVRGSGGEQLLLDAGSGVQQINPHLDGQKDLLVLLSHLHLDHLLGLPMLALWGQAEARIRIHAIDYRPGALQEALARIFSPPLWPLTLEKMAAEVSLHTLRSHQLDPMRVAWRHGGLNLRGAALSHPNGCTAWRIDEGTRALVFATDVEWSGGSAASRQRLFDLCRLPRSGDLLIMDGHFTAAELPAHRGWGHSSIAECVEVARAAGVPRLLCTHHAPGNDDSRLAQIEAELQALWSGAALARQGEEIDIDGSQRPTGS